MRYRPGQRVRVRDAPSIGHVRTPSYVKGKAGRVERVHGVFGNPESLAYGGDGLPEQPLYLIRFDQREVWSGYAGSAGDRIYVDVYEHWLLAAENAPHLPRGLARPIAWPRKLLRIFRGAGLSRRFARDQMKVVQAEVV